MLDVTTAKGRIIDAAMRLAGERAWDDVTVRDIAEAAQTSLVELRKEFPSKPAILSAFGRAADDAVLMRAPKPQAGQPARDRIFDVLMTRLDVLTPYRAALKSVMASRPMDVELARRVMASQAWMLHAAGVPTDGLTGLSRVAGMASIYTSVLDTWLTDDDPGLARTMAALDRRLKRGEQAAAMVSDISTGAGRAMSAVGDILRGLAATANPTPHTKPDEPPAQGPGAGA